MQSLEPTSGSEGASPVPTRGLIAWAAFDWANSAFPTLITTFVFATYFSQGIIGDPVEGQSIWGVAAGVAGLLIAVLSPIFGAISDAGGPRKPWILVFTAACVAATALLWFAKPDPSYALLALVLYVVANIGFEFGVVFNNAMLGDLARPDRIGRWSGWAWGFGYFGGLLALAAMLVGFVTPETPWFGVGKEDAENIRVVGPLAAVWFAVFSAPFFLLTPDRPTSEKPAGLAVKEGIRALGKTFRELRRHANAFRFLVARMIYNDGVIALFAFGGIYAAGRHGMSTDELILFGIGINVTAGLGAIGFAWLDDRFGSRRVISWSLIGLSVVGAAAIAAPNLVAFLIATAVLGIFVGPVQAASRSLMTRLAPPELRAEFFGLYALSGKATTFLASFSVAGVTAATGSQTLGVTTLLAFWLIGLLLLRTVQEPEQSAGAASRPR